MIAKSSNIIIDDLIVILHENTDVSQMSPEDPGSFNEAIRHE